ncbi:MAG TPA: hypothetical protein DIW31_09765 [Bacteroidales bacterium]|nr:hypothetical protein [Bacteroidales bacterium]
MVKKFFISFSALLLTLLLVSWGGTGHRKISEYAGLSFNSEMSEFNSWVSYIKEHASDADNRKSTDNSEGPKHYINIDNYSSFLSTGKIDQTAYGSISSGILPWATINTYNYLVNCFTSGEFEKAKQFAADLGHYVADGHMPMHITKNFDGQYSGNNGIHSRYESTMIGSFNSSITYSGSEITYISDINQYVFDYIYQNYKYVDSILIADNYAVNLAAGIRNSDTYYSYTYKEALWNKTKGFTITLFKNASHALAELIYTAWVTAGKPSLTSTDIINPNMQFTEFLEPNSPNPFKSKTSIKYNLPESSEVTLRVNDMLGNTIVTLVKGFQTAGSYKVEWIPENQYQGIYFLVLDTPKLHKVRKMMIVR